MCAITVRSENPKNHSVKSIKNKNFFVKKIPFENCPFTENTLTMGIFVSKAYNKIFFGIIVLRNFLGMNMIGDFVVVSKMGKTVKISYLAVDEQ